MSLNEILLATTTVDGVICYGSLFYIVYIYFKVAGLKVNHI